MHVPALARAQVYTLRRPTTPDYWRAATCEQAGCRAHLHGWTTTLDESTDQGQAQGAYIRRESGRAFVESRNPLGLTVFTFEAGQTCFAAANHRAPVEREPLYLVHGKRNRQHTRGEFWVEDSAEHLDKIRTRLERG
jgi:hypothetical protein